MEKFFPGQKGSARFKRRATALPKVELNSTASFAVLHGSSSTWFRTSCSCRAELNSQIKNTLQYILKVH